MPQSQEVPYNGPERIAIAVMMRRSPVSGNRWVTERWAFEGCVPDSSGVDALDADVIRTANADDESELVRWRGLTLELHRDACEDYWFNLSGDAPRIYLVARSEQGAKPEPVLVTLDHGEAGAYGEADDDVFSAPLPAVLYGQVERFVMTHFKPRTHHKRKRKNWSEPGV